MNTLIDNIRQVRQSILNTIGELSLAQLNEVPEGFNNNIIWNLAHLIAAQQGICYLRAGQELQVEQSLFELYKPGTKPVAPVTAEEVENIKGLLLSTIDQFKADFTTDKFINYQSWTNRYGCEMDGINTVTQFLFFHDGLHFGYIMVLKRVILKNNL